MVTQISSSRELLSNKVLIIGFKTGFHDLLKSYNYRSDNYIYTEINDLDDMYSWLHHSSKEYDSAKLPFAIICDLEFLNDDNYQFLALIKKSTNLSSVPFITVTTGGGIPDKSMALKRGIDDCYSVPINWRDLNKRIKFLHKYKAMMIGESNEVEEEVLEYKMPLGKRMFDIFFSGLALLCLSPILLIIALAIKMESKGPIVYKSKRAGTGFQVFGFLKFRSMVVDADKKLKELEHLNRYTNGDEATDKKGGNTFIKLKDDPRITRVGKFIRKTSLDELPQLVNVLKGDMSIVGNRPLPLYEAEQITKDQWAKRFMAPAGITGLWQINKQTNDIPEEDRIDMDIQYAEKYSLWFDLKIILSTIPAMLQADEK